MAPLMYFGTKILLAELVAKVLVGMVACVGRSRDLAV